MASDTPHKGIMLAERPAQAYTVQHKTFVPSSGTQHLEPIGLTPVKKVQTVQSDPQPNSVNHQQWVQEVEDTRRALHEAEEAAEAQRRAKRESVTAFGQKLRAAILSGKNVGEFWKAAAGEDGTRARRVPATTAAPAEAVEPTEMVAPQSIHEDADATALAAVTSSTSSKAPSTAAATAATTAPPLSERKGLTSLSEEPSISSPAKSKDSRPGTSGSCSKGRKASNKPAWAMSGDQAEALQEQEEMELLKFADNLDFESFVEKLDDIELQDTFKALQEAETSTSDGDTAWRSSFVRALNHVAMKQVQGIQQRSQGDGTGSEAGQTEGAASRATHTSWVRSEATAARLAAMAGKYGNAQEERWDSSIRGDNDGRGPNASSSVVAAEEFLLENPELKGVHSNASVRAMLMKTQQQALGGSASQADTFQSRAVESN